MSLQPISSPLVEPVSLVEAKAHLRLDHTHEDVLISSLVLTSRLHIEAALELALITQAWTLRRDAWPANRLVRLPMRPVQSVDAIRVLVSDAETASLPSDAWHLDGLASPATLAISPDIALPRPGRLIAGIEIDFTAGFGDAPSDVPGPIRQALLLLVAHWYEHRAPFESGGVVAPIPAMVSDLLRPYRSIRL